MDEARKRCYIREIVNDEANKMMKKPPRYL